MIEDGLLAHWRLDETSGTRVDATGNGYNLTAVNNPGSTTGKIGNAALFAAASNQWLDSTTIPLVPSASSWTFAGWAREDSNTWGTVVAMRTATGEAFELQTFLGGGPSDGIFSQVQDDLGNVTQPSTWEPYPGNGVWFFWTAWWDKDAATFNYQVNNGTVYNVAATGAAICTGSVVAVEIGTSTSNSTPWDGAIDSVSLWSRALTSAERTTLYNGGAGLDYPFFTPNPSFYRPITGPTNSTTIRTGATALGALDYAAAVDYAAVYDYAGAIGTFADVVTGGTVTTASQDYAEQLDYAASVDYAGVVPVYGYSAIVRQEGQ